MPKTRGIAEMHVSYIEDACGMKVWWAQHELRWEKSTRGFAFINHLPCKIIQVPIEEKMRNS